MEYEIHQVNGELTHWGIKGMRWGIRRYQKKDGSLTAAGKKRYDDELAKVKEKEATLKRRKATQAKFDKLEARKKAVEEESKALKNASNKKKTKVDDDGATAAKAKTEKKSIKDMTDDELNAAINRARLEDTYRQLRPAVEKHPIMKKVLNEVVAPAALSSGRKFLESTLSRVAENTFKTKVDPNSLEALRKTKEKLQLKNEIEKLKNNKTDNDMSWDDKKKKAEYDRMMADKELDDMRRANNLTREKQAAERLRNETSSDTSGKNTTSKTSDRSPVTESKPSGSSNSGSKSPITSTRPAVNSFINKIASQPIRDKNPDLVNRVRGNTLTTRHTKPTTGTSLKPSDITFGTSEQTSTGRNYVQNTISKINWRDMNWDDE